MQIPRKVFRADTEICSVQPSFRIAEQLMHERHAQASVDTRALQNRIVTVSVQFGVALEAVTDNLCASFHVRTGMNVVEFKRTHHCHTAGRGLVSPLYRLNTNIRVVLQVFVGVDGLADGLDILPLGPVLRLEIQRKMVARAVGELTTIIVVKALRHLFGWKYIYVRHTLVVSHVHTAHESSVERNFVLVWLGIFALEHPAS